MKKTLVLLGLIALIFTISCKKDSSSSSAAGLNNQDMVTAILTSGMSWNTHTKALNSTVPINIQVDNAILVPECGNIHVQGSVTGSMTIDNRTSAILGGTMLLGLTETINDYAFKSNGQTYTMTGAPYVSLS